MAYYGWGLFGIQLLALTIILLPIYFDVKNKIQTTQSHNTRVGCDKFEKITIILPMRNEAINAEKILLAVLEEVSNEVNCKITVIDSNSSDGTGALAQEVLEKANLADSRWEVIPAKISGKSHAINLVLDSHDSDLYVMIDADTTPFGGWLGRMLSVMSQKEIGAASGVEDNFNNENQNISSYKSYSKKLREKQSMIDTTPILEGGLMCWKSEAIGNFRLDESANADDAQIVFQAIRNGFRTVIVSDILFHDTGAGSVKTLRYVRRSQGLSRILVRNVDLCFIAPRKNARSAICHAISLYVFFPWGLVLFVLNPFWAMIYGVNGQPFWPYLSMIAVILLLGTKFGRTAFWGGMVTIYGQLLYLSGTDFSTWDPHRERIEQ